jgi:tRNA(Ile)-lysidine synthase
MKLMKDFGYSIIVAYFHHQLRTEADLEAKGVESLGARLDVPFLFGTGDTRAYASQKSLTIEEAGRELRYRFLFSQAKDHQAQAVAVAHTADDQVETFLMHLLRGSGLSGLKGMQYYTLPNPWSEEIPLIRPLLSTWKEDILRYIQELGWNAFFDQSNLNTHYARNRIRQELLPYLETFNPQIKRALWQTADLLAADSTDLEEHCEDEWRACLLKHGEGYLGLDLARMRSLSLSLQRRLFRRGMAQLRPGLKDVDYATIQRAIACLNGKNESQYDLVAGVRIKIEVDLCWMLVWEADLPNNQWPQLLNDEIIMINPSDCIDISENWKISSEIIENDEAIFEQVLHNPNPYQAWLDEKSINFPLVIRSRKPGDRFQPLGMADRTVKASDFMINNKLPSRGRARWPLICYGDDIIWIPGYQIAHRYRAQPESERLVHIRLFARDGEDQRLDFD